MDIDKLERKGIGRLGVKMKRVNVQVDATTGVQALSGATLWKAIHRNKNQYTRDSELSHLGNCRVHHLKFRCAHANSH